MISAVIIDDELHSLETLSWKINEYCEGVQVLATFSDPTIGLAYLESNEVDLLFLDIEMPVLSGFDVLQKISNVNFDVIFTTAYDEYGIKAIKYSALDYLLKPIDSEELQNAIAKYRDKKHQSIYTMV